MRNESKLNAGTFGLVLFAFGVIFTIGSAVLMLVGVASWLNLVTGALVSVVGLLSFLNGRKARRQQEAENDAREAAERERGERPNVSGASTDST